MERNKNSCLVSQPYVAVASLVRSDEYIEFMNNERPA
jgi:hypothetical protein